MNNKLAEKLFALSLFLQPFSWAWCSFFSMPFLWLSETSREIYSYYWTATVVFLICILQYSTNSRESAHNSFLEIGLALIFFARLKSIKWTHGSPQKYTNVFLIAAIMPCLLGISQFLPHFEIDLWPYLPGFYTPLVANGHPEGRMNSIFPHANSFAFYVTILWPFFLEKTITKQAQDARSRILLMALGSLLLICLVSTGSRSGMLTVTIISAIILSTNRQRLSLFNTIITILLIVVFLKITHPNMIIQTTKRLTAELEPIMANSGHNRLNNWRLAMAMIQQRPWVGYGPGSFNVLFERYYHVTVHHPHNLWLMLAAEQGIPAAILITGTVIGGVIHGVRQRYGRLILGLKDPFVVSSIGLFILCLFDVPFYKWQVSFLAMVILAMAARLPEEQPATPELAPAKTES